MKISELIALLSEKQEMHGDLEVQVGYEGIFADLSASGVYKAKSENELFARYRPSGESEFLCLDIEGLDKHSQAVDPSEGEPS